MSSRSRRIVDLALKDARKSGDESDPFSSFDSDIDPMFLPSSDEDMSATSDLSELEYSTEKRKRKLQPCTKISKTLRVENNIILDKPCCSKSLLPGNASPEGRFADITTSTHHCSIEKNENIPPEEFEEFFEVETVAPTQPPYIDIVQKQFQDDIEILSTEVSYIGSPGENYTCELLRVVIKFCKNNENTARTMSMVVKRLIENDLLINFNKEIGFFDCEFGIYSKILPTMKKLKYNKCVSPKAYYLSITPKNVIVLEDLSTLNYKVANRQEGLNLEHCLLSIEKLAYFHAASLALYETNPKIMDEYNNGVVNKSEAFLNVFSIVFQETLDVCKREPSLQKYYKKINEDIKKKLYTSTQRDPKFNVLNHGDFWCNNLMFQYNEEGSLKDVLLIDFQFSVFASPFFDLHYFIATSTSPEVKENHVNDILHHYYNAFLKNVKVLKIKTNVLNWKNFEEEFCNKAYMDIVQEQFQDHIEILSTEVSYIGSPGENYTCELLRVVIKFCKNNENTARTMSMVVKRLIESDLLIKFNKEAGLFDCEFGIYSKILPMMEKLKYNKCVSPKAYYLSITPKNVIVLEDLSTLNYKVANRQEGLNLEHCLLSIEKLAYFHAASLALYEMNPKTMDEYNNGIVNKSEAFLNMFSIVFQETLDVCKREPSLQKYYKKINEDIKKKLYTSTQRDPKFNVLNHGDFWCNNLMFQYNEDGSLKDVLLIDFQFSVFTSPFFDLHYFIATSTSPEVKENHVNDILHHYYNAFLKNVKTLKIKTNVLNWKNFKEEFCNKAYMGFTAMCMALPYFTADKRDDASIFNFIENGKEGSFRHHCFTNHIVQKQFQDDIEILSTEVSYIGSPGENYTSELLRVIVKFSDNNENAVRTVSMVVKRLIENDLLIKFNKEVGLFDREFGIYSKILPMMEKIKYNKCVAPKAYYLSTQPKNVLVLEDLSTLNYKIANRQEGLNLEHCLLSIEKLAYFHAASLALYEKNPKIMDEYSKGIISRTETFLYMFSISFQETLDVCKREPSLQKYYKKINEDIKKKLYTSTERDSKFNVLNHGDFWCNNLMFQYNEDDSLKDVLFIDFQFSVFASPFFDLHYFITTSTSLEVKENHVNDILHH
ncbi:hypothetical protein RN001_013749 [Aquatica leii]|uniref:CHK kinase-like domain-containing protein n=1 Tax=Aquatica leii TaxID=1421715 RepID=A0AAN7P0I3_9COLE|nr:hypothetical protein RN001_013749 [Aquatica leii]